MRSLLAVGLLAVTPACVARASLAGAVTSRGGERGAGAEAALTGGVGAPVPPEENAVYGTGSFALTSHPDAPVDLAIAGGLEYANHRVVPARIGVRVAGHHLARDTELAWGARIAFAPWQRRSHVPHDPDEGAHGGLPDLFEYEFVDIGFELGVDLIPHLDDEIGGSMWIVTLGLFKGFDGVP